jgi:hypothetical protein
MTHQQKKIDQAKELIYSQRSRLCVLLCSFGKDSMTLLHLIREVLPPNRLSCHTYPVAVIYHRQAWFPAKNQFADRVIRSWALEIHTSPPLVCGVKCNSDRLELVARYPFGEKTFDLPLNTEKPLPRRAYGCGYLWILQPKTAVATWPWQVAFHGHKNSDVDPYEGPVPLRADQVDAGGVHVVFPLRNWTDADVWDYIHACTACIDPRETAEQVYCPKLRRNVPNMGHKIYRLGQLPAYIGKEE